MKGEKLTTGYLEARFFNLILSLFFCFIFTESKNKKAAALPFVLATPLDSEKGEEKNNFNTLI